MSKLNHDHADIVHYGELHLVETLGLAKTLI